MKEKEKEEFYFRLCFDVLLEVLSYGTRRNFAKLEHLGVRFHMIISEKFQSRPFLWLRNLFWYLIIQFLIIWESDGYDRLAKKIFGGGGTQEGINLFSMRV